MSVQGENPNAPQWAELLDLKGDQETPKPTMIVNEQPLLGWREAVAIVLLVVLCDLTIYRGHGFAGYALLFVASPILLVFGSPRPRSNLAGWIVGAMLTVLAAKMLWCGSILLAALGFALLVAFAAALSGVCPHVLDTAGFALQATLAGSFGLAFHWRSLNRMGPAITRIRWLSIALPLAAFMVFGLLFVLANPDLRISFGKSIEDALDAVRGFLMSSSPSIGEVVFWGAALIVSVGLLRPLSSQTPFTFEKVPDPAPTACRETDADLPQSLYPAFRNTLLTVIVLFAIYLIFEFMTLWFREFPKGFYYSGYAHEGAAWLTVALALATLVLSLVFKGRVLQDSRLPRLRRLAWLWSLENMLLAIAVYNRLYIYIGFNGMTRMRMVGIFGMSAVVIGFVLVVWKIAYKRDFVWLMQRHLWTLALTIYLFALMPTDAIVTRYNVCRVMAGDPSPAVQISVHPISSEGVLFLEPLVDCDDETIREGIRAMLAARQAEAETTAGCRELQGWTAYQIADDIVLKTLQSDSRSWAEYSADPSKREAALRRFHDYVYQWY